MRSVINLCRDLRLSCVIEGVETARQLAILEEMGGNLIQGFFFAKPMPADQISSFLGTTRRNESESATQRSSAEVEPAVHF